MTRRRAALTRLLLLALALPTASLRAQGARDSLLAGRRAYEGAALGDAIRLLQQGLPASAGQRDTVWVGGAHMLADALLGKGQDTLAALWTRWIVRTAPGMAIDSSTYPPRVAQAFARSRAALGATGGPDSAATTWEPAGDPASGRGVLRILRANVSTMAIVDGVGTMLPGESRAAPAGTYAVRITADGYAPLIITREVLPGFATVVMPRFARTAARATAGATPSGGSALAGSTFAAGGGTTCAILDGVQATCWGENRAGQFGSGVADSSHVPALVAADHALQAIAVGSGHACGLTATGRASCWGQGANGELGTGRVGLSATPSAVTGGSFVAIGAGVSHSCALNAMGGIYCWGTNRNGELGNHTNDPSPTPVTVSLPEGVRFTALTVGGSFACALATTGAAYCWGENSSGQLGVGSTRTANAPVQVQSPVPFRMVVAGGLHACALSAGGSAYCWGANGSGQLGLGAQGQTQSLQPAAVSGGLTFTSLAAGDAHTCGLTADGGAYCWGAGRSGQLGNDQSSDSPRPVLVVGGQVFRALALGSSHSCGWSADDAVWCWGDNTAGQLGVLAGRSADAPVPVLVRPVTHAVPVGLLPVRLVREAFDDGNWTAAPAWAVDSTPGAALSASDNFFEMTRARARPRGPGAGLALPVRIPVNRTTRVQFDVMVLPDSTRIGCGLNCASWPAVFRVRVKNTDLTESEAWYAYGDRGGRNRSLGSVVIVARGDAEPGHWYRGEHFTIRDALPRADTILQISIGSTGTEVGARFDNILVPRPVPTAVVITPDSALFAAPGQTTPFQAVVRDSAGAEVPRMPLTWRSSDTAVARVDAATGLVTAVGAGRALIRASAGALADSAAVVVTAPPAPAAPAAAPAAPPRAGRRGAAPPRRPVRRP
jgi:alpha-tubulin suppressor-like RCC1 family protein